MAPTDNPRAVPGLQAWSLAMLAGLMLVLATVLRRKVG
ncbi:IPTL-CTERM sorting domain-containing protein [Acidovorax sp. FG27]